MNTIFRNVISASLSPNTTAEDVLRAWKVLLTPWTWRHGAAHEGVARWFRDFYDVEHVSFFQSGRVALYEILTSLNVGSGDEVLVQAFTCVAVPNSVKWAGATPVYVDIDDSLNMDPADLAKKITSRTKAIVVQHTFGVPADMTAIMAVAGNRRLLVIEDCAHAIGATYNGKKVGTFGDAAFFSFGRDKAISSVWGGAAFMKDNTVIHPKVPMPGFFWIFRQLLHPVAFSVILPTYNSGIGKAILVLLQRLNLLSKPVDPIELIGGIPPGSMTQFPNGLAQLLEVQLKKLPAMIGKRQANALYFEKNLAPSIERVQSRKGASYLRYPVLVDDPVRVRKTAKARGVLLGNWYHHVIDPLHTDLEAAGYKPGSCPRAESVASRILNLPTLLSQKNAAAVVDIVR